jgi:hypothetical protein
MQYHEAAEPPCSRLRIEGAIRRLFYIPQLNTEKQANRFYDWRTHALVVQLLRLVKVIITKKQIL